MMTTPTIEDCPRPRQSLADVPTSQTPYGEMTSYLTAGPDITGRVPTRSPTTIAQYRRAVGQLETQAEIPGDLDAADRLRCLLIWYQQQRSRWRPSVIRYYRAALAWAVQCLAGAGELDRSDVGPIVLALAARLKPRARTSPPRASADKRMTFSMEERDRLVTHLVRQSTGTSWMLAGVLGWGPTLSLRPCELRHARVRGRWLVVRCAKFSNRRGVSRYRFIDLVGLDATMRDALSTFLLCLKAEAEAAPSWDAFHERLAKALTRACCKLGIRPISLYTVRHQGLATAKRSLPSRDLAAFAGHASPETASRHYASRRGGWRQPLLCKPAAISVARVRAHRGRAAVLSQNLESNGPSLK